jgi:DNA (cytosine-5)-methyltransferase 1
MKDYNYIDLFSGIMGFSLGAYWAGMKFKNHFYSEIDPYCLKLAKLRFPEAIALGDIKDINLEDLKSKYGTKWILTGGFPCQDISVAGRGEGIHGTRSSLWFNYYKAIRILQPQFAIIENVGMLVARGLDTVLGNLAEIRYDAEWQDIRAEDVGAPHKRERIWIVAHPSGLGWSTGKHRLPTKSNNSERQYDKKSEQNREGSGSGFSKTSEMANPSCKRLQSNVCPRIKSTRKKKRTSQGGELSRRNTKNRGTWTVEPSICGMADGLPPELYKHKRKYHLLYDGRLTKKQPNRNDRLKGLGNSIVPQIAELLFNLIKPYLETE